MKYIFKPLLAVILTVIAAVTLLIVNVVSFLWNFKIPKELRDKEVTCKSYKAQLSPYAKPFGRYKTIFHYIWGIR